MKRLRELLLKVFHEHKKHQNEPQDLQAALPLGQEEIL